MMKGSAIRAAREAKVGFRTEKTALAIQPGVVRTHLKVQKEIRKSSRIIRLREILRSTRLEAALLTSIANASQVRAKSAFLNTTPNRLS